MSRTRLALPTITCFKKLKKKKRSEFRMSRDNVQITHHLQQKNLQFIRVFLDKCHKCSSKKALRSSYSSHPMRSQYIDALNNWHEQQPNINAD